MDVERRALAEQMLRTRSARLRAYLRVLLGNASDVEDVLQDVWVKFLQDGPAQEADHGWRWLLRVSRNAALDLRRGGKRRRQREEVAALRLVSAVSDPAAEAEGRAARERISSCLDSLPDEIREAVYLKFGEDLSLGEIAGQTGAAKSTVAKRVEAGLIRLNRCYHGFGNPEV